MQAIGVGWLKYQVWSTSHKSMSAEDLRKSFLPDTREVQEMNGQRSPSHAVLPAFEYNCSLF